MLKYFIHSIFNWLCLLVFLAKKKKKKICNFIKSKIYIVPLRKIVVFTYENLMQNHVKTEQELLKSIYCNRVFMYAQFYLFISWMNRCWLLFLFYYKLKSLLNFVCT